MVRTSSSLTAVREPALVTAFFPCFCSFFVEHFIKDLGIALAEAKRMGAIPCEEDKAGISQSLAPYSSKTASIMRYASFFSLSPSCAGLSLPGLALANQLYLAVQAQGHGRMGA